MIDAIIEGVRFAAVVGFMWCTLEVWIWAAAKAGMPLACYVADD